MLHRDRCQFICMLLKENCNFDRFEPCTDEEVKNTNECLLKCRRLKEKKKNFERVNEEEKKNWDNKKK